MPGLVHILSSQSIFIKPDCIWEAILASAHGRRENVEDRDGTYNHATAPVMTSFGSQKCGGHDRNKNQRKKCGIHFRVKLDSGEKKKRGMINHILHISNVRYQLSMHLEKSHKQGEMHKWDSGRSQDQSLERRWFKQWKQSLPF